MKRHYMISLFLTTLAMLPGLQACQQQERLNLPLHPQSVNVDLDEYCDVIEDVTLQDLSLRAVGDVSILENLGMGYQPFSYPFANARNTTFSIIRVDELAKDPKIGSTVRVKNVNEAYSTFSYYTSFAEYTRSLSKKFSQHSNFGASFGFMLKTYMD